LPANSTSAVIGDLNRPMNMAAALAGVDTIIHSAGNAPTMTGSPGDDFRQLSGSCPDSISTGSRCAWPRSWDRGSGATSRA
jgi:UDP-glucose 4-epimerase